MIITCSHRMSSIDHIHSETKMLQVEDHLNLLSAQYLVQCLDTENQDMDLPPREMKETIFTIHYQTVLRLLANNRKDTLQALHTLFVNTAIDNMKDNRVLNNRPPPINDEKTLLSRRQRTTLSRSQPTQGGTVWQLSTTTDASKSRSTPILTVCCSFQLVFCLGSVRCG